MYITEEDLVKERLEQEYEYEPINGNKSHIGMQEYKNEQNVKKKERKLSVLKEKYSIAKQNTEYEIKEADMKQIKLDKKDKGRIREKTARSIQELKMINTQMSREEESKMLYILKTNNEFMMYNEKREKEKNKNVGGLSTEIVIDKIEKFKKNPMIAEKFSAKYVGSKSFKEVKLLMNEIVEIEKAVLQKENIGKYLKNCMPESYEFIIAFSAKCRNAFENALVANGLVYENGLDSELRYATEDEKKSACDADAEQIEAINLTFKQLEYDEENRYVEEMIKKANEAWKKIEGEKEVEKNTDVVSFENIDDDRMRDVLNKILGEKAVFLKVINLKRFQINYLKERKSEQLPDNYDLEGRFQDAIDEMEDLINKVQKELDILKKIFGKITEAEKLDKEEKEYIELHYGIKMLELENQENDSWYLFSESLIGGKIDEICGRLKDNISRKELLMMKQEICSLADIIELNLSKYVDTPENSLKIQKILAFAKKARAVELIVGFKKGIITLADLTIEELNSLKQKKGKDTVSDLDILEYAQDAYNIAEAYYCRANKENSSQQNRMVETEENLEEVQNAETLVTNEKRSYSEEEVKLTSTWMKLYDRSERFDNKKNDIITDTNHVAFSTELVRFRREKKEVLEKNYKTAKEEVKKKERLCDKEKNAIKRKKLQYEINVLKRTMAMCEIAYKLKERYYVYGNKKTADRIMRSITDMDNLEVFKRMNNQEIFEMTSKMSAGVFEEDERKTEIRNVYKNKNIEGMCAYKEKLRLHYIHIREKYGVEYPSLQYLFSNFEDFSIDMSSVQIDSSITDLTEIFDESNTQDMKLKKVIKFYHELFSKVNGFLKIDIGGVPEANKKKQSTYEGIYDMLMQSCWEELKPKADEIKNYDL